MNDAPAAPTKKVAPRKPVPKPVAESPAVAKPAVKKTASKRKPTKPKSYAYQRIVDGVAQPLSTPYAGQKMMLDDISLQAEKDDVIVIFRESRRGSIKTKVRIA